MRKPERGGANIPLHDVNRAQKAQKRGRTKQGARMEASLSDKVAALRSFFGSVNEFHRWGQEGRHRFLRGLEQKSTQIS